MDSVQTEFTCKCGQQKGWIGDGQTIQPCPNCGRVYKGKYSRRKLTIEAKEVERVLPENSAVANASPVEHKHNPTKGTDNNE